MNKKKKPSIIMMFVFVTVVLPLLCKTVFAKTLCMTVTAYDNCELCTGKTCEDEAYGITKNGSRASWGTVAVDPSIIPFGTYLKIEGYDNMIFTAEDIGMAIKGNRIDVWMDSHKKAKQFGIKKLNVQVIRPFHFHKVLYNETSMTYRSQRGMKMSLQCSCISGRRRSIIPEKRQRRSEQWM